ncbi:hypothetical protein D3C76_1826110 [compost metagenome]
MQGTYAHHAVEPFAQQIHLAVSTTELHLQPRKALQKLRQRRDDDPPGHHGRQVDAQAPCQLGIVGAEQALDLVHA